MTKDKIKALFLAAMAAGLAAQPAKLAFAADEPCASDRMKFCADVKPGGGQLLDCLNRNAANLTPSCKTQVNELNAAIVPARPCAADQDKFCRDVKPGGGQLLDCLTRNAAKLAAPCKAQVAKLNADVKAAGKPKQAPAAQKKPAAK